MIRFQKSILEELLLILDPAEQYGANFLICLNGESKYVYLQIEEDKNMQLVDDYEAIPYQYIPPVAKKWNNLESDLEIQKLLVTDTRPKVGIDLVLYSFFRSENLFCTKNFIWYFLKD